MHRVSLAILLMASVCIMAMLVQLAFGAEPDMGTQSCVCIEGKAADEIEKLRTQIRLLKAEAVVNKVMRCAAAYKGKKL